MYLAFAVNIVAIMVNLAFIQLNKDNELLVLNWLVIVVCGIFCVLSLIEIVQDKFFRKRL